MQSVSYFLSTRSSSLNILYRGPNSISASLLFTLIILILQSMLLPLTSASLSNLALEKILCSSYKYSKSFLRRSTQLFSFRAFQISAIKKVQILTYLSFFNCLASVINAAAFTSLRLKGFLPSQLHTQTLVEQIKIDFFAGAIVTLFFSIYSFLSIILYLLSSILYAQIVS